MNGFQDPKDFEREVLEEFQKSAPDSADSIKIHSVPMEVIKAMIHQPGHVNALEVNCVEDEELLEM